jgi:hypothetical protein
MVPSYDNPHLGSFHSDELAAFFAESVPANANDKLLFAVMRDFWTNFVASERPSTGNESSASWNVRLRNWDPHGVYLNSFLLFLACLYYGRKPSYLTSTREYRVGEYHRGAVSSVCILARVD